MTSQWGRDPGTVQRWGPDKGAKKLQSSLLPRKAFHFAGYVFKSLESIRTGFHTLPSTGRSSAVMPWMFWSDPQEGATPLLFTGKRNNLWHLSGLFKSDLTLTVHFRLLHQNHFSTLQSHEQTCLKNPWALTVYRLFFSQVSVWEMETCVAGLGLAGLPAAVAAGACRLLILTSGSAL